MSDAAFKVFFGNRSATAEELRRIEEIRVEQTMDAIWEANIKLSMCLDERGRWRHGPDEFRQPFTRVRVEVQAAAKQSFVALIDGPVVSFQSSFDSQPGRSTVSLVVRDDGVFLNREERTERYDQRTDQQIVQKIFGRHLDVLDSNPAIDAPTDDTTRDSFQRETDLVFLRKLAHVYERYHAYVLPTSERGKSQGCFRQEPAHASTEHPSLVMLGGRRNLATASVTDDSEGAERTRSYTMELGSHQMVSYSAGYSDATLSRALPPVPENVSAIRNVRPQDHQREDPSVAARRQINQRAYSLKMTARVVPCYPAVLAPYIKVPVEAGPTVYSGDWLIHKVTHRITPSVFVQEFEAKINGQSNVPNTPTPGGVPVNFSGSVSLY